MARSVQPDEKAVGQALIRRHARVGEVLVENQGRAGGAGREASEVGRGVAVDVEHPGLSLTHQGHEVGKDAGVETAATQVDHRDPLLLEEARGGLSRLQTHERHREARGVETRKPPGKEPRHSVDAGAFHPELVADVHDADGPAHTPWPSTDVRLEVQTTAPDSDSSTISPAPTRLKARALSRDRPIWPK